MIRNLSFFQSQLSPFFSVLALCAAFLHPAAQAQVTYTGTAAHRNFGSQAMGTIGVPQSFSFSVASGTTVGSIAVVTTGTSGLDFSNASGSTCAPRQYTSATTCTVEVSFTALGAGLRTGAVVFYSEANNTGTILGGVSLYGIGTGPQIAFGPGVANLINPRANGSLLTNPVDVALDAADDLYIVDLFGVVEVPASGSAAIAINPIANGQTLYYPSGIAIDGAGNLFISDFLHNRIVKVPAGGGTPVAITATVAGKALNGPYGVAVDATGDLYIADLGNRRVVEIPAGGAIPIAITPSVGGKALDSPQGVAVDATGNLYIADTLNRRVVEVPVTGPAVAISPTVNGLGMSYIYAVALDGAGDLFIADTPNNRMIEVPANGGAPIAFDPTVNTKSLQYPKGMATDAAGDVYIADSSNSRVVEIQRSLPPAVTFATPTVLGTTDTADGMQTTQIINVGNQPLNLSALSYPADFSAGSGDTAACTSTASLSAGQQCDLTVEFTPEHSGSLNEFVTLDSNTRNGAGTSQPFAVSGKSLSSSAALLSPKANSTLGASATFTWSTGEGVASYQLLLGTAGAGSSDIFNSGTINATSAFVPAVPAVGVTVYARLISNIGGVAQYADYTFVESCTLAVMLSPTPGVTLPGSSATFSWTTGGGVTAYEVWMGLSGPGSSSVYDSGSTSATSVSVTRIPTSGATLYVRLYSMILGKWQYNDYTYVEK
jgi:sugar lactone lactonase YvrE